MPNPTTRALALLAGLALCGLPRIAQAVSPDSTDAREIMSAVEDRDLGDKGRFKLEIVITDKAGRSRTRSVAVTTMQFDEGRKELMLFESPADVRNSGLLSIDYDAGSQTDDQFLYLPSLGRTTRIAGADKAGSFMGTDLSYADMTKTDTADYDYTLLEQNVQVDGEDCWLVEARPRTDKAKEETGYLKTHVWVSKDKLVPLQSKAWVVAGKKLKYTLFKDWRKVDGIWVAHDVTVRTTRGDELLSTSTLTTSEAHYNLPDVDEAEFTERRLEQGL